MKKTISLIVAVSENGVIGKNNQLIWHLPADLRYFKEKTVNKSVIMGRKTFESIVESIGHPLPNRHNIVITSNKELHLGASVQRAHNLSEAIKIAIRLSHDHNEIMILGGGNVYEQALPFADKVYLTRIHHFFDGNVFFPDLDVKQWHLTSEEHYKKDNKNAYDYSFLVYERRV